MGHYQLDHLHVHYYDFAYEPKGPFRMAAQNIGDAPAKTFAELLSGPLVDIYVGEQRRHWSLHRNLLCHQSTYFETELDGGSTPKKLNKTGKLELVEEDPGAFELLVKWLYQGKIDDVSAMPVDKKWDYADSCQKLYILCNRIQMPQLKNIAIDQFRKGCNEAGLVPGPEEMKPIYEKTSTNSPFRKLVSRIAARQIMDPDSEKDASSYRQCFDGSPDFAIDVINAIRTGAGGTLFDDPTEGDPCEFHEHENGQACGDKLRKGVNFANGTKEPPKTPNGKGVPEGSKPKIPKPPDETKLPNDIGPKKSSPPDRTKSPGDIGSKKAKPPDTKILGEGGPSKPKPPYDTKAPGENRPSEFKPPDYAKVPARDGPPAPKRSYDMSGANGILKR